jgi:hypothetical protein
MVPDRFRLHHKKIMTEIGKRLEDIVVRAEREFASLSDAKTSESAISGGWSRKQILGHLIDSASNNHQRFVRALLQDELRWPGYDQSGCVRVQHYQEARWSDLVGFWANYNRFLAHVLARVPDEKRKTQCFIGDYRAMTLEELAVDYVKHMEHHLGQVKG